MNALNAIRSRHGTATRSRIKSTVVGTRNASATQPQDWEKYAPSLAFVAVTMAATAAATTNVLRLLVTVDPFSTYSVIEP